MARALPADYLAALEAPTRRPEAQVLVYYGASETELDITRYVGSLSVSLTEGHRAGRALLDIANPRGLFDPIGGGAYADALAEDTRVVIRLGHNGSVHTAFTGRVARGRMRYQRGEAEALEITCFDMGKRFWRQQITSTLYEEQQANGIVSDLFTTYGGMSGRDLEAAADGSSGSPPGASPGSPRPRQPSRAARKRRPDRLRGNPTSGAAPRRQSAGSRPHRPTRESVRRPWPPAIPDARQSRRRDHAAAEGPPE